MKRWFKTKWTKLRRWYLRVFHNIHYTVKPSGTISTFKPYGGGIEPLYGSYKGFTDVSK